MYPSDLASVDAEGPFVKQTSMHIIPPDQQFGANDLIDLLLKYNQPVPEVACKGPDGSFKTKRLP